MIHKLAHDYRVQGVQFEAPAEDAVELDPQVAQLTQDRSTDASRAGAGRPAGTTALR